LKAVIDFAFEHLGIHTIYGECHVENVASARVMEKAGLSRLCRDGEDLLFVIQK
jgi:RimJ/RimL family protein N-acetyltransferase